MRSGRDNYLSSVFFFLLPIADSKILFKVAPDFEAFSPNLAIKDFSASNSAALGLNLILLVLKINQLIV